jgi:hypothetical protein
MKRVRPRLLVLGTLVALVAVGVVLVRPVIVPDASGRIEQSRTAAAGALLSLRTHDVVALDAQLAAHSADPVFAHHLATHASPRDLGDGVAGISGGDVEVYDRALHRLAASLSLATHGAEDLTLPPDWASGFASATTNPKELWPDADPERYAQDRANKQNLLLLLSRGRWSTGFLQEITRTYWDWERVLGDKRLDRLRGHRRPVRRGARRSTPHRRHGRAHGRADGQPGGRRLGVRRLPARHRQHPGRGRDPGDRRVRASLAVRARVRALVIVREGEPRCLGDPDGTVRGGRRDGRLAPGRPGSPVRRLRAPGPRGGLRGRGTRECRARVESDLRARGTYRDRLGVLDQGSRPRGARHHRAASGRRCPPPTLPVRSGPWSRATGPRPASRWSESCR